MILHFPKATRRKIVYATAAVLVSGSALLVWKQLPKDQLATLNGTPSLAAALAGEVESSKDLPNQKGPATGKQRPEESEAAQAKQRDKVETYVVQPGENIGLIAERFGLKTDTLLNSNGLDEDDLIQPGDELLIPRVDGIVYEVQSGDTLWGIAQDYGVTDVAIAEANKDVDPGAIQPGTKLLIPGGEPSSRRQVVSRSGGSSRGRQFMWPTVGPMTDPFGWRVHPVYGTKAFHDGLDIGVGSGTPLRAATGGTVIMASRYGGYGLTVRIDHGDGLVTQYAHMSQLDVSVGERVAPGDHIGYSGNTGVSTGPHLHFSVLLWGEPVDPISYLP